MSNHITLPAGYPLPKFNFLQQVQLVDTPDFGTITGLDYIQPSPSHELTLGWWYMIDLDPNSPNWQRHSFELQHEDSLTLLNPAEAVA